MMQNKFNRELKKGFIGRDHHPSAFKMWQVGGEIETGVFGSTDDFRYCIGGHPVSIHDLKVTILNSVSTRTSSVLRTANSRSD